MPTLSIHHRRSTSRDRIRACEHFCFEIPKSKPSNPQIFTIVKKILQNLPTSKTISHPSPKEKKYTNRVNSTSHIPPPPPPPPRQKLHDQSHHPHALHFPNQPIFSSGIKNRLSRNPFPTSLPSSNSYNPTTLHSKHHTKHSSTRALQSKPPLPSHLSKHPNFPHPIVTPFFPELRDLRRRDRGLEDFIRVLHEIRLLPLYLYYLSEPEPTRSE
ncbi:hypothetical protein P280DRAFT_1681 [Massarina eburnea CBS 473.64]|uniref:Uncharacterized protein n=1 Tax=Massarina eburnea CBS 473.64 TaxID=1395130 RepID=A0A6A6SEA2_9PLEO|nr:hypothetical protein P280DRAFT_1681 [Massarina eburnea CBS 473.64]